MARPKLGEEKQRHARVAFLTTMKVRKWLEKESKRRKVSMGDIANEALEQSMEQGR